MFAWNVFFIGVGAWEDTVLLYNKMIRGRIPTPEIERGANPRKCRRDQNKLITQIMCVVTGTTARGEGGGPQGRGRGGGLQ